jgi:2-dehydro-3-deoxygluconokinase
VSADVLTAGEALVAFVPDSPVPFEHAARFDARVGGAEVNFAVCLAGLGQRVAWYGVLGDDAAGRMVLRALRQAGVEVPAVTVAAGERTGIYLRDWQPDGERRPTYYRAGSAARLLEPDRLPADLAPGRWLHLTGITAALGDGPRGLLHELVDRARRVDARVSFDPNYRPALWPPKEAAAHLGELAARCDVLLMSEEDSHLLFGGDERAALDAANELGPSTVVLKRGRRGALAVHGDNFAQTAAVEARAVDPVGAGDAFNAGFVAALLDGASLDAALAAGARLGALATEHPGEHPPMALRRRRRRQPTRAEDSPAARSGDAEAGL